LLVPAAFQEFLQRRLNKLAARHAEIPGGSLCLLEQRVREEMSIFILIV